MPESPKSPLQPQTGSPFQNFRTTHVWVVILLLLLGWLVFSSFLRSGPPTVPYSFFRQQLQQDNVQEVTVQGPSVQGRFKNAVPPPTDNEGSANLASRFQTYTPAFGDEGLLSMLESKSVELNTRPEQEGGWITTLILLSPLLLLFGLAYMQQKRMREQAKGLFSIGKSKAKLCDKSKVQTLFDDVAGAEGAKTELQEVVAYLKNPERPDPLMNRLYQSALRSLVQLSAHEIVPGPFNYRRFWFRDAVLMSNALILLGLGRRVRPHLDVFPSLQKHDGYFRSQEGEWDSNGQVLWLYERYCRFLASARSPVSRRQEAQYKCACRANGAAPRLSCSLNCPDIFPAASKTPNAWWSLCWSL